jgi:hypothetical protein
MQRPFIGKECSMTNEDGVTPTAGRKAQDEDQKESGSYGPHSKGITVTSYSAKKLL